MFRECIIINEQHFSSSTEYGVRPHNSYKYAMLFNSDIIRNQAGTDVTGLQKDCKRDKKQERQGKEE